MYARDVYSEIKQRISWDASPRDEHLDGLLRELVINRLVDLGDEDFINEGKTR